MYSHQRYLMLREAPHRSMSAAFKGNVSVHSHWITEEFTPGSNYSPYCRLILQWYLHFSSTQKHQIILVNYTTLIGLNCVQCFCVFPLRFGETNIFSEFRMAEDTTLPRILSYRLGLHHVLCLTNPVISLQALWLDVGVAVREVWASNRRCNSALQDIYQYVCIPPPLNCHILHISYTIYIHKSIINVYNIS